MEEIINNKIAKDLLREDYDDAVWLWISHEESYHKHDVVFVEEVYQHKPSGRYFKVEGSSSYNYGTDYDGYHEVEKKVEMKEVVTWVAK